MPNQIFLLSPARAGGARYSMLLREQADFDLARNLRLGRATFGEVYTFISSLYFRGKMAYAEAFGAGPAGIPSAFIIVPGAGLVSAETCVDYGQLSAMSEVTVSENNPSFREPLIDAAKLLDQRVGGSCSFVLLGSVASGKYTNPLLEVFEERLLFPIDFVGRGDMSRGGLMLRHAVTGVELPYTSVRGALLRGARPPRLEKRPKP